MTQRDDALAALRELAEEQAALRRVATLVAGDAEPAQVFACVCQEVGHVLGVETTNLVRFERDGTATIVGAWAARGAPVFPVADDIPLDGETVAPRISRSGRSERVDDYDHLGGELARRLRAVGIRSAVGAPVKVAGRLWGAVIAASAQPGGFAPDAQQRIAGFAELVTNALASADAREQLAASRARIVQAGDAEPHRLGRDLHDGAQQQLVSAVINLQLAQQKWTRAPERARELVNEALDQAQAAIRDLRELAGGIHPSVLTHRGLAPALEALATRSPVPVELEVDLPERLPIPVETTAYFVVAEALTNVAKHARCTHALVSIRAEPGCAHVEVRDDGIGGADVIAGSGLRGLDDRLCSLNGRLEVSSPPRGGTTVRAQIPVRTQASE